MINEKDFFAEIKARGFNLTEQQKQAVVHNQGPLMLLAVPGAGKTTVLTVRLAYLILVENVDPRRILCLTFGRAAAKEMRERFVMNFGTMVSGQTEGLHKKIHFSTIHSFAYEVVRTAFRQRGIGFEIIEEQTGAASKMGVLRRIYEKYNLSTITDEQLEGLQNAICYVKNTLCKPEELAKSEIENFSLIYNDYENYKQNSHPRLIDYDDMLSLAFQELKENQKCLEVYRKRFDHILTDESQDTSLLQHRIIEMVVKPKDNIFVVGDDDQSIFGFRAAEPKYLLEFEQTYPGAKILRMEQNFRSTPQIVEVACGFIRSNKQRFDKDMFTENPKGDVLQMGQFAGIKEQNQFIVQNLKNQNNLAKVGVLYRNNLSAICLAEELDRANIVFYMRESGKQRFFSHWAINDILNLLRFSFSDKSLPTLERIWSKLSCPIRKQHLDLLKQVPIDRSIFEILAEQPGVTSKGKSEYLDLKKRFKELNTLSPTKAIDYIRNQLEYDKAMKRICESLGFSEEYVGGLLDILSTIAQNERTIVDFANRLTYLEKLMMSSYKNKHNNAVTLSTIHSAKGLEWEQVYLIDLVEGIIPEGETIKAEQSGQSDSLEEERRLFYVGMTRAKRQLTLCSMSYYHHKRVKASRFLREVNLVSQGKNPLDITAKGVENQQSDLVKGLVVQHKAFGEGVIVKDDGNVIMVLFKNGAQRSFMKDICEKESLIWAI
ncbi:ATP-dependent helicase [Desulfosporosinus sp. BICA1-9]|uniref:ATP-dependent helicase n=1 Tax=Desulfosporosinus sp. BICA1-9 TaxID=1531958 RepID=UPI00054B8284|nr:ATP-dependent helicase [Desulfosporosinus sp. BICA1-9]KJS47445.1 MAG: DNA helicase UvrD [Peptococcaceae bacterium BRH_c23]KJS89049.1 MAG: DNA helicase UvrD [Desulfosporosinus sp. BICA1-9]